jgi:methylenetetrahydrofolate dehydrogenase (NADP+)/methenyltetrahydrofolate cyclohydrolase
LDRSAVINAIDPAKDVDALTSTSVAKWQEGRNGNSGRNNSGDGYAKCIMPATARGVRELLENYKIDLNGKKVTVVGRSDLVGKPIAAMCRNAGATVTVCHSKTVDLVADTKNADILIVAVGKPKLIGKEHINSRQVVIDVGINTILGEKLDDEIPGKRLVGDVDFEAVKDIVSAISPVPGGVGPMTVLALFENLVDLCR